MRQTVQRTAHPSSRMYLNQGDDYLLRHPVLSCDWGGILHEAQIPEWKLKLVVLNSTLSYQICVNEITLLSFLKMYQTEMMKHELY